jgi:hypothetical protein
MISHLARVLLILRADCQSGTKFVSIATRSSFATAKRISDSDDLSSEEINEVLGLGKSVASLKSTTELETK